MKRTIPLCAELCWIAVLGAGFFAGAIRSVQDGPFIYSSGVRGVYPEGHLRQVEIFKGLIPRGTIFYIMDRPEFWQMGQWRRSLYPDYSVIPVYDPTFIHTPEYKNLARKFRISYVLCAGNPPPLPDLEWKSPLPFFPGSVPILIGKLGNSDVSSQ